MYNFIVKIVFLILGDLTALYGALIVTLLIRQTGDFENQLVYHHLTPFSIIFSIWILIFYISGLYALRNLRNRMDFYKTLSLSMIVNAMVAIAFFYLIPIFEIAPKTNLFLYLFIYFAVEMWWRRSYNAAVARYQKPIQILLVGTTPASDFVENFLAQNPQLGYRIAMRLKNEVLDPQSIAEDISRRGIKLIVIPHHLKKQSEMTKVLFSLFVAGVEVSDIPSFQEVIVKSIPVSELDESWFFDNDIERERFYDSLKRAAEALFAVVFQIALLPLEAIIAALIKLTSKGPVIYKQTRVGKNGKQFTMLKFRTMKIDAEKNGVQWASVRDSRATLVGQILRLSHLDELPQLVNIARGELSFIGPRPERPEFVAKLKGQVPYYETRLLVKPGVTGWAQINYRKDTEMSDVAHKLEYDVYYLKNRSLILDLAIILKTLKAVFVNHK